MTVFAEPSTGRVSFAPDGSQERRQTEVSRHFLAFVKSPAPVAMYAPNARTWHGKPFETVRIIRHEGATKMGSMSDKTAGLANKAAGTIKKKVGEAVGNERLQAEGSAQVAKGHVQEAVGDLKAATKKVANKVADTLNKKL